jgi:hypothetical protein
MRQALEIAIATADRRVDRSEEPESLEAIQSAQR